MFTQRTQWSRNPNRLAATWSARLGSGLPAIDLTESNPTRCGFTYPEAEILRALADPRGLLYEPAPAGLPAARRAVAEDLGLDGWDSILLTASTSEAYGWLFKLLCERDDEVLIPRPSYPLFDFLAALEEVRLVPYPLRYEAGWRMDFEALESALTPRTRAVLVVHPNNPTGNYVTREEWQRLSALCAERDLAVISDEVFHEYAFENASDADERGAPDRAPSLALEAPCLTFSLGGLSKAAGLPQIKVGWIHVGGPAGTAREAFGRLEVVADTYLSVNTPAQWALPSLLQLRRKVRDQIRSRVRANRRWILEEAAGSAPWELLRAEGGWYAVIRVPRIRTEEEWCCRLAEEEGVLLHPGYFFDFESEAYLVASLLPEEVRFREGMNRLLRAC